MGVSTFIPFPGGSGGGSPDARVFRWDVATSWATIYASILAHAGTAIVMVEPDAVPRLVTAGPTNLDNVAFVGLPVSPDAYVAVDMEEGVVLGPGGGLRSKDVLWRSLCTGTRLIGSGPPCSFVFDGGGMIGWTDPSATNPIRLDPGGNQIRLANGAVLSGAGMPPGNPLVVVSGGGSLAIRSLAGSSVGAHAVGGGIFASAALSYDASSSFDPGWIAGFIAPSLARLDSAGRASYDDALVTPPSLGTDNVQGALDALKGFVPTATGVATLGAVDAVVLEPSVQGTSKFVLTTQDTGAPSAGGAMYVSARVVGVSFTISSSAGAGDTGAQVYWQLWP